MSPIAETIPPTEARHPRTADLDLLPTEAMLRLINAEEAGAAEAVAVALPAIARVVEAVAGALAGGGRLIYVGAGTSGRMAAMDAAECPPTFGVPATTVTAVVAGGREALSRSSEGAEDDESAGSRDLEAAGVRPGDVVVGVAASGRTPYTLGALRRARELGCRTAAVVNNPGTPLATAADIAVEVLTGPEALTGSTRMKAGTAQKMVLNLISTGAMVRLGRTYSNLMLGVQATNAKLVRRIARQVAEAVGRPSVGPAEAEGLLEEAGGDAFVAVIIGRKGLKAEEARAALAAAGGSLRRALGEKP